MASEQANSSADGGRPRTRAEIESDLSATRERLANSVVELIDLVHPNRVKERQIETAKTFAKAELENAKSQVFHPDGGLRTTRIAAVGGAVVGLVTCVLVIRGIAAGRQRRQS